MIQDLLRDFDEDPDRPLGRPAAPRRPLGRAQPLRPLPSYARSACSSRSATASLARSTDYTNGQLQQIEQALYPQNLAFVERLRQLGIPVQFDNYGPGIHNWPYWQRELHRSLPCCWGPTAPSPSPNQPDTAAQHPTTPRRPG